MSALTPIYRQWLDETQKRLADEYRDLGFKASGRYEKALEPFINSGLTGTKIGMLGAKYSLYMSRGRGSTAESKRGRLQPVILQWLKDKGIVSRDPSVSSDSLAWMIATKIDKKGYSVSSRPGVITNVITDQWINELTLRIGNQLGKDFRPLLTKLIKGSSSEFEEYLKTL
jgi:hypothetical protein